MADMGVGVGSGVGAVVGSDVGPPVGIDVAGSSVSTSVVPVVPGMSSPWGAGHEASSIVLQWSATP